MSLARVRRNKVFLVLWAALLAAGLFLTILHTHYDLEQAHDCVVCHFVRLVASNLVLLAAALLFLCPASVRRKFFSLNEEVFSLFFVTSLRGRAPPFPS